MLIKSNGAKWRSFDYTVKGKRKTLSMGVYPATGLADARRKAQEARVNVANGIDSSAIRNDIKTERKLTAENEKRLDLGLPSLALSL